MKTDAQVISSSDELVIPWNLSEWADPAEIRQWVVTEIGTLDWEGPKLVAYLCAHPGYRPRMLLCLLTFAYATGTFESDEILRRCTQDEDYQKICDGDAPQSPGALARFRRENRGLLKWALLQVLKRAMRARFGEFRLPAGLKRSLVNAAVCRLDVARQMDRSGALL